ACRCSGPLVPPPNISPKPGGSMVIATTKLLGGAVGTVSGGDDGLVDGRAGGAQAPTRRVARQNSHQPLSTIASFSARRPAKKCHAERSEASAPRGYGCFACGLSMTQPAGSRAYEPLAASS